MERSFCTECGSSIASFSEQFPALVRLSVGCLENKAKDKLVAVSYSSGFGVEADMRQETEIWTREKSEWVEDERRAAYGPPPVEGHPFKL